MITVDGRMDLTLLRSLCSGDFHAKYPTLRSAFYIVDGQLVAWPD